RRTGGQRDAGRGPGPQPPPRLDKPAGRALAGGQPRTAAGRTTGAGRGPRGSEAAGQSTPGGQTMMGYSFSFGVLLMLLVALILSAFRILREYERGVVFQDRKSTRLNSSHVKISYAVFCLQKKTKSK